MLSSSRAIGFGHFPSFPAKRVLGIRSTPTPQVHKRNNVPGVEPTASPLTSGPVVVEIILAREEVKSKQLPKYLLVCLLDKPRDSQVSPRDLSDAR